MIQLLAELFRNHFWATWWLVIILSLAGMYYAANAFVALFKGWPK